jgi:hypothetical protein
VPQAHIYFQATETGQKKLFIAAFRSDGYRQIEGGLVANEWWIEQYHTIVRTLDVPDDIVAFAVESERLRQIEVGDMALILQGTVTIDLESGLLKFLEHISETPESQTEDEEHEMGLRVQRLLEGAGGLH